jgi:hypothetical protein
LIDLPQIVSIAQEASGRIRLVWRGTPRATYQIETSLDLETWIPLTSLKASEGSGLFELLDTTPATAKQKFYRAVRP